VSERGAFRGQVGCWVDALAAIAPLLPLYTMVHTNVEHTDEFAEWYRSLNESQQDDVAAAGSLLMELGPKLPFPHSSGINGSKHAHMRELRVQSSGRPLRIFHAFDPRPSAILLIGGDKTGDGRFYERMIPIADELYDVYLDEIREEGLIPWPGTSRLAN
jgi:hypothetical protein